MRRKVSESGQNVVTAAPGVLGRNNYTANRLRRLGDRLETGYDSTENTHKCGMPSASAGRHRHSAPRNSPASPLRHTAASVQITVAPSILHSKDGGDPDDPSQITSSTQVVRGHRHSIRL